MIILYIYFNNKWTQLIDYSASEFSVEHNKSDDLLVKEFTLYSKSIVIENKFNNEFLIKIQLTIDILLKII